MWIEYNPNPRKKQVGDCVIRAISKALDMSWEDTYTELCIEGFILCDLPSSNYVWSKFLKNKGFKRYEIDDCPDCYTIKDFCREHPKGVFVVGTGSHAVTIINGNYYDAWESSHETPIYYFEKQMEN